MLAEPRKIGFRLSVNGSYAGYGRGGKWPKNIERCGSAHSRGLITAKKVFISNAGADSGLFPHPFSGHQNRGYNQFYSAVQKLGQYEMVTDPANADLVLEIQLTAPAGPANANKQNGATDPVPMFRLVIFDGKTHYILWALTESIDPAALQRTHDLNFDKAIKTLVSDLARLSAPIQPTAIALPSRLQQQKTRSHP